MNLRYLRYLAIFTLVACIAFGTTGCGGEDEMQGYIDDGYPVVNTMDPTGGLIGTIVTVVGEQFGAEQGEGKVIVYSGENGAAVNPEIVSWTDKELKFRIPSSHVLDASVLVEIMNSTGKLCPYPLYLKVYSGSQPANTTEN